MTIALAFERFSFTYAGATVPSLSDVTLRLPAGKVVTVVAPQGMGKTTLLRAAAGLIEEGGLFEGEPHGDIYRSDGELPGAFFDGYVQVTLAVETVREEIALSAGARTDEAVASVAQELKIEHLLDREVTALSGGEEKLVGLAAALVDQRYVYVLDEPFEQLDTPHFAAVIRAARRRARRGALVLIATGSIDTALNIADAVVVHDGERWRLLDPPTYDQIVVIPGLTESSLTHFLDRRSLSAAGIRRFRDAVIRAS